MVGHILYPNIDPDNIASLSPIFITDILRGELGFDGIVMSDSFTMQGLSDFASVQDAAVRFILAGGDVILCGVGQSTQTRILDALLAAANSGVISRERLEESVYRILGAKSYVTGWTP